MKLSPEMEARVLALAGNPGVAVNQSVLKVPGERLELPQIALRLPWPPTMNTYWRSVGTKVLISEKGRLFRKHVAALVGIKGHPHLGGRVAVWIDAYPPDRRQRDLDNLLKPVLDALAHANVYDNDEQIDELLIRRKPVMPGQGQLVIVLSTLKG